VVCEHILGRHGDAVFLFWISGESDPQSTVNKQISALEDELGTELIHRTSRSIALDRSRSRFYESALRILEVFENTTSRIGRGQTAPKGVIRVTVPPTFARLHMVSKLPACFDAYPDMAVELAASESLTMIILPVSTLVARRFAQRMIILVATPQYLTRYGAPESPDDLDRFRCVVLVKWGSVRPWSFSWGQDAKRVIPTGVFRTSDIEQMRMGVLEHLGITQAPAWLFAAKLTEGIVIRLLTPFERTVCRSLRFDLLTTGCPPKYASSPSIWRRLSRSVQFNPPR
jgi:LysR family transcriptional regulator for bpeEF and oprC